MKVGFNARLLMASTLRGWNRYTVNLMVSLAQLGVELILYSDRPVHAEHLARLPVGSFRLRQSPAMRYLLWEQWWLPTQVKRDLISIFHCPFHFGLPWICPCPRILTLHDAIGHTSQAERSRWTNRLKRDAFKAGFSQWIARSRAEHIITVSEHSKNDLTRSLHIAPRRMTVIYEAADESFSRPIPAAERAEFRRTQQLTKPYLFYVGGWEERKNVEFLVRAFADAALPDVELILAGGRAGEIAAMQDFAKSLHIADRVRILSWIDDRSVVLFYAEALCFVYPSRHEGFGLQLCEAMAAGCAVLAANSTSLPEVLGEGGETFALDSPADLTAKLRRAATDPVHLRRLREMALKRSPAFSWNETATKTLAVYEQYSRRV